jgi:hypothetical protein
MTSAASGFMLVSQLRCSVAPSRTEEKYYSLRTRFLGFFRHPHRTFPDSLGEVPMSSVRTGLP